MPHRAVSESSSLAVAGPARTNASSRTRQTYLQ